MFFCQETVTFVAFPQEMLMSCNYSCKGKRRLWGFVEFRVEAFGFRGLQEEGLSQKVGTIPKGPCKGYCPFKKGGTWGCILVWAWVAYLGHMVVSTNRGTPIKAPKHYNPYSGDPTKLSLILGRPKP